MSALAAELVGVDISRGMLRRASKRCDGVLGIDLVEADAADLPFDDASFDAVVSTFGLSAVPDERAASAEACRVLRPGGRFALVDARAVEWPVPVVRQVATRLAAPAVSWHRDRDLAGLLAGCGLELRVRLGRSLVLAVARKPA